MALLILWEYTTFEVSAYSIFFSGYGTHNFGGLGQGYGYGPYGSGYGYLNA